MNQEHQNHVPAPEASKSSPIKAQADSLVDALLDVGATWAAYGLKVGKMALETSAITLEKTAHALDALAGEIEKKSAAKAHTPVAGDDAPEA